MSTVCGTGSGNFPQPGDPDLNGSVLSAVPAFGGIDVVWTYPGLNPQAVAHTILFRSTNADPGTKVQHRIVTGDFYYDKVDPSQNVEYFYWIQIVSVNSTVGDLIGPASATARPTIEQMLVLLTGQISDGNLAQNLKEDIQRIDSLTTTINSETAGRLAQYEALQFDLTAYQNDVDGVATLLADEVVRLETDDTSQINQINVLGAKTDDNSALIINESEARADADSALAMTIDTLQASSAQTFYQDTAPDPSVVTLTENDIWVDTTEPADGSEPSYTLYQWDGSGWFEQTPNTLAGTHAAVEAERLARVNRDGALAQTIDTVETSVGRKSRTFFQANPPVAENVGDLWIDTNDGNKFRRWDGTNWVDGWDTRIDQNTTDLVAAQQDVINAMSAASAAQATADGAIRTYYQATAPTGLNSTSDVGDLWFDTDDDQAYRWGGSTWRIIEDNSIATALAAAQNAQGTADGKITTFYMGTTPTAEGLGDLWVDTDNGNLLKRWTGSAWQTVRDSGIAIADGKAVTAQDAADAAAALAVAEGTEAEVNAAAYTDGEITIVEAAAISAAEAYTDEREVITKSYADGIVTTAEQAAIDAAALYTDAERALAETVAASYADGIVTAEEERAIQDATEKADAAELAASNLANTAQQTADSKNQVFIKDGPTIPTAKRVNDLYFDRNDDDKGYRWDGTDWIPLNLYTGNQVTATIEDYNATRVGYCMVNGSPDSTVDSKAICEATSGGVWLDMYAIADAVKGVQVTDGDGQVANVQQRMISYKDELGVLNSEYTVKVQTDVDGNSIVGGFGIATDSGTGTVQAGFDVDQFWVGKLGMKTFPFIIEGSETFIKEAVIRSLTIGKLKAENGTDLMFTPTEYAADGVTVTKEPLLRSKHFKAASMKSTVNVTVGTETGKTFDFAEDGSYKLYAKRTGDGGIGGVIYDEDGIRVYDAGGNIRVKLGKL